MEKIYMKVKKSIDYKDTEIDIKIKKTSRPPADLSYAYGDVRSFGDIKRVHIASRHVDEITDNIRDILEKHADMDMLSIRGNLEKIEGLDKLRNLKFLFLNNNKIKKIEGLENLTNLLLLDLSRNKIKKIEGLDTLTKLRHLDLNNNDIEKIEGLGHLINLEFFNLYRNPVYKWAKRKFGGTSMDRKKYKNPQAMVKYCQSLEGYEEYKKEPSTISISSPKGGFQGIEIDFGIQRLCPACGKIVDLDSESCAFCDSELQDIKPLGKADEISIQLAKTALNDPNFNVRMEAIDTLGGFKEKHILGLLAYVLLNDPNAEVRKEAADELGDIHHPYSLNVLTKGMNDKSPEVRKEVIEGLKKLKKKVFDKKD
jgi:hypothetical protein